jgi:chemotaxis methyl-accepting protein methylase
MEEKRLGVLMLDDNELKQLLAKLDLCFEGYRRVRKGVKKRLRRHMLELGCKCVDEYIIRVEDDPDVRRRCDLHLLVSISRFFRDLPLWEHLEKRLLPRLVDRHNNRFKVWSAGCACGEEAYSFGIVWELLKKESTDLPELFLLGTDANPACIARAREGSYPASSMREIPGGILTTYFQPRKGGKRYEVIPHIKAGIHWQIQHLRDDPPGDNFHIIFLRNNLLTYYGDTILIPVLSTIVAALAVDGLLVIGSKEMLPKVQETLVSDQEIAYCFWKTQKQTADKDH